MIYKSNCLTGDIIRCVIIDLLLSAIIWFVVSRYLRFAAFGAAMPGSRTATPTGSASAHRSQEGSWPAPSATDSSSGSGSCYRGS